MREQFEQLILDFYNSKLPVPSKREKGPGHIDITHLIKAGCVHPIK